MSEPVQTPVEQPAAAAVPSSARAVEEPTEPTTRLYIGNLPSSVKMPEVRELLAAYGKLPTLLRASTNRGPRARKFAFVTFPSVEEATKARSDLTGKVLKEGQEPIKVAYAAEPTKKSEAKPAAAKADRSASKTTTKKEKAESKPAARPRAVREKLPESDDSVFIKGLQKGTTKEEVSKLFEKYANAEVTIVVLPAKRELVRPRYTIPARAASTIAFVKVGKDAQATVISEMNGVEFQGHALAVNKATMSYEQALAEGKIEPRVPREPKSAAAKEEAGSATEPKPEAEAVSETEAKPEAESTA